jgi:circadian clock protein KaiC
MNVAEEAEISEIPTGIPGFDLISYGGLPKGRTTLVSGTSGSAKTVFAAQFLIQGILQDHTPGVFITFEESPDDIRKNLLGFNWNIAEWEDHDLLAFVDASAEFGHDHIISGTHDMGGLIARIEYAINKIGAKRVSLDSIGALLERFDNTALIRRELLRIVTILKQFGVTALLTAERTEEHGAIARYGVEEFVADNVIILRNSLFDEKRRRTIEILKFRGTDHQKGEFPFTIRSNSGIVILPLSAIELTQSSNFDRVSSGNDVLDQMCGGGFFQDSLVLITGATGCGKTLVANTFLNTVNGTGNRAMLLAFEESHDQIFRNARGWGMNFDQLEQDGLLKIMCVYPETRNLEDHLIEIQKNILDYKPSRIAIDSLSALHRVGTPKSFREFVVSLSSFLKFNRIASVITSTSAYGLDGFSVTEEHISTITDTIVLLRYIEFYGEMHRGLAVLKMRGSYHDKQIREFSIDGHGLNVGRPFRQVTGILRGDPQHVSLSEMEWLNQLFSEDKNQ